MTAAPPILWLPDGQSCHVKWYLSDGRAVGVQGIADDWLPHRVGPSRTVGYGNDRDEPHDPDRDDWVARDGRTHKREARDAESGRHQPVRD